MKISFSSVLCFFLVAVCYGPCLEPASAGTWEIDHYVSDETYYSETIPIEGKNESGQFMTGKFVENVRITQSRHYARTIVNGEETECNGEGCHENLPSTATAAWHGGSHYSNPPITAGRKVAAASGTKTVRAVFQWNRDHPNDNPPEHLWVIENATIYANERIYQFDGWGVKLVNDQPYPGSEFYFENRDGSQLVHPFGVDRPATTIDPNRQGGSFQMRGTRIVPARVVDDRAFTENVTLSGRIRHEPSATYCADGFPFDKRAEAELGFGYSATPVFFEIAGRTAAGHDPDDLLTGFHTSYYGHTVSIDAGHKAALDHNADLVLILKNQSGYPIVNTAFGYVPALRINNGQGVNKSVALLFPRAGYRASTDASGRIPLVLLRSKDLLDYQHQVDIQFASTIGKGIESVFHHWSANHSWRKGENGQQAFNGDFRDGNQWLHVRAHGRLFPPLNSPIPPHEGHDVRFGLSYLQAREEQSNGTVVRTELITDRAFRDKHPEWFTGQPIPCVDGHTDHQDVWIYKPQLEASDYGRFVSFADDAPEIVTSSNDPRIKDKIFKTRMTVQRTSTMKVEKLVPILRDYDVFEKVP